MPCPRSRPEALGPLLHWVLSGESFFNEAAEGAEAWPSNAQAKGLTFFLTGERLRGLKPRDPPKGQGQPPGLVESLR